MAAFRNGGAPAKASATKEDRARNKEAPAKVESTGASQPKWGDRRDDHREALITSHFFFLYLFLASAMSRSLVASDDAPII